MSAFGFLLSVAVGLPPAGRAGWGRHAPGRTHTGCWCETPVLQHLLVAYREQAREPAEQCQSHPAGGETLVASGHMK